MPPCGSARQWDVARIRQTPDTADSIVFAFTFRTGLARPVKVERWAKVHPAFPALAVLSRGKRPDSLVALIDDFDNLPAGVLSEMVESGYEQIVYYLSQIGADTGTGNLAYPQRLGLLRFAVSLALDQLEHKPSCIDDRCIGYVCGVTITIERR